MTFRLLACSLLAPLSLIACASSSTRSERPPEGCSGSIEIVDEALAAGIRGAVGLEPGEALRYEALDGVESLDAADIGVQSLGGIQCMTGLRTLELANNAVEDLSPLSGLSHLTALQLDDNAIEDLGPLAGLTRLRTLQASNNAITDVAPLSDLRLVLLELDDNMVDTVQPLSGIASLVRLSLRGNGIGDVAPLNSLTGLSQLRLGGNPLDCDADAEAIDDLQALIEARGGSFDHDCP